MLATASLALDFGILDRLIAIFSTFALGVGEIAKQAAPRTATSLAERVAPILFDRLATAVIALSRIALSGLGPDRKATPPNPTPSQPAGARAARSARGGLGVLPRRPGWLLEALPDTAPALAADLAPLLATPAVAALIAARPANGRKLRPVLNALGLTLPPLPPPPPATSAAARHPTPEPAGVPPLLNRHARRAAQRRERRSRP